MTGSLREINWLTKATASADDAVLRRVVQVLDKLHHRGEADKVLELARKRLRALRPPRPLQFTRVLFMPMDGAIVPNARWRRGDAALPRSVLLALSAMVSERLPATEARAIEEACEGRTTLDRDALFEVGGIIWPAAARLLPAAAGPAWQSTGLPTADYTVIAQLCRPIWEEGLSIWAAVHAADQGPPEELVKSALSCLIPHGNAVVSIALATIMQRATRPGQVALAAANLDPATRVVAQSALDAMVDEGVPQLDQLDLPNATATIAKLSRRLEDLEQSTLMMGDRQRRIAALRSNADEAARNCFVQAAEQHVLAPVTQLASAPQVDDAEVAGMEAEARNLRALEGASRRIGSPAHYDRTLANLADALATLAQQSGQHPDGLQKMDMVRLTEILAGTDAASQLLNKKT